MSQLVPNIFTPDLRQFPHFDLNLLERSKQVPPIDIALLKVAPCHGDHCAVGPKPDGVAVTYSYLNDISPVANIALSLNITSHGDYCAVFFEAHRMNSGKRHRVASSEQTRGTA